MPKHQKMSHHQVKLELGLNFTGKILKFTGSANMPVNGCIHTELKHNISTKGYKPYLKSEYTEHWLLPV